MIDLKLDNLDCEKIFTIANGDIILINGDCEKVLQSMINNESKKIFDCLLTDPPYILEYKKKKNTSNNGVTKTINNFSYAIRDISTGFDYQTIFNLCQQVCKSQNYAVFCSQKQLIDLLTFFENQHQLLTTLMIWNKTNPTPAVNNCYLPNVEFIVNVRESTSYFNNKASCREKSKVYTGPVPPKGNGQKRLHPTQKPVDIIKWLLHTKTKEGDIVFDTYGGACTTAIACHQLKRRCLCIEKDKTFFDIACDRLKLECGLF